MLSFLTPAKTAIVITLLIAILAVFQLGLSLGLPWGDYTLGGAYSGVLPLSVRYAAAAQIPILILFVLIVLARAGLYFQRLHSLSRYGIWLMVAVFAVSVVLNTITPSAVERQLWLPVAISLFLLSLRLARAA